MSSEPAREPSPEPMGRIVEIISAMLSEPARGEFLSGLHSIEAHGSTVLGPRTVELGEYLREWYWSAVSLDSSYISGE